MNTLLVRSDVRITADLKESRAFDNVHFFSRRQWERGGGVSMFHIILKTVFTAFLTKTYSEIGTFV